MRLNLGCGFNRLPDYINVDKFKECSPDQVVDLDLHPWPWNDESVTEIQAYHVLEHLGETTAGFIEIMRDMYRVLCNGGLVHITVPHARSDGFLGDPTHVRIINANVMSLFSQTFNRDCAKKGWPNTPLGLYHNIDFELVEVKEILTYEWSQKYMRATAEKDDVQLEYIAAAMKERFNVIADSKLTLRKIGREIVGKLSDEAIHAN